jgi:hypothetical protein
LLASVWAAGATYTDPSVDAANAEALLSHIAKVQADGTTLPDGLDLAFVSPDGAKIERIIGFFVPLRRDPE